MESVKVKFSLQYKESSPRRVLPLLRTNSKFTRDNSHHTSTYPSWRHIFSIYSLAFQSGLLCTNLRPCQMTFSPSAAVRQPNFCAHLTFPHVPDDIISVSGFSLLQRWSCVHSPTVLMQLYQVRLPLSRIHTCQSVRFMNWWTCIPRMAVHRSPHSRTSKHFPTPTSKPSTFTASLRKCDSIYRSSHSHPTHM